MLPCKCLERLPRQLCGASTCGDVSWGGLWPVLAGPEFRPISQAWCPVKPRAPDHLVIPQPVLSLCSKWPLTGQPTTFFKVRRFLSCLFCLCCWGSWVFPNQRICLLPEWVTGQVANRSVSAGVPAGCHASHIHSGGLEGEDRAVCKWLWDSRMRSCT